MALIDRLARRTTDGRDIPGHDWEAALWLLQHGDITKANVVALFSLTPGEEADLDTLVAFYNGLSAGDKKAFFARNTAATIALQHGHISDAKYLSLLGMT